MTLPPAWLPTTGMSTVTVLEGSPCLAGYTRLLPAVEVILRVWNIFSLNLLFRLREQQEDPGEALVLCWYMV